MCELITALYSASLLSIYNRDKNAPLRADAVFERMQDAGVEADTVAWTIMITIWSRSKLSEKESKVQEIFERYALTLSTGPWTLSVPTNQTVL